VFALAFGVRAANYQNDPITDELYHLLAAESWAADGSLAIADGEYRRAALFTMMVGLVHSLTDGSVDAIRIFCILVGSLLVATVYAWTARILGTRYAVIAAFFLALMPGAIFLSQHIRFYSLHALVYFWMAWIAFDLATTSRSLKMRAGLASLFLVLALVGIHLQITTLVGLAGIAFWILVSHAIELVGWIRQEKAKLAGAIVTGLVVAVLLFVGRSRIVELIDIYEGSALWNSGDNPLFYYLLYRDQLGAFWSAAPIAFVVALVSRPKVAFFCTCIFVVAFVLQSFGGMRSERFLFYAMPFFFIIWSIAIIWFGQLLRELLVDGISRLPRPDRMPVIRRMAPAVIMALSAAFLFVSTPAFEASARMITGRTSTAANAVQYWERYEMDWAAAAESLQALSRESDVVLVSQALHALYYLGDYDYSISATAFADVESYGVTNTVDPRTGRPIFDDAESMLQVLSCHDSGFVIIHKPAWRNETRVKGELADEIERYLSPVEVPAAWGLLAFRWTESPSGLVCPAE
jgi:hypothetical protein